MYARVPDAEQRAPSCCSIFPGGRRGALLSRDRHSKILYLAVPVLQRAHNAPKRRFVPRPGHIACVDARMTDHSSQALRMTD